MAEEPELRIGTAEGEEAYLFDGVRDVVLLPDGGVAVADQGSSTVRVFDASGAFQGEMGGAGDGPGEVRYMASLDLLPPDTLVVYDVDPMRLTRFLTDGTLVSTTTLKPDDGRPELVLGRFSDGSWALSWISQVDFDPDPSGRNPDPMRVGRFDADGSLRADVGRTTGMVRMDGGVTPFSPYLHGVLARDSVFVTDGLEAEITVLDGQGGVARTVAVPVEASDADRAWAALERGLEARDQAERLEDVPEGARDEPIPHLARLLADHGDRLWVKPYVPSTDTHLLGGFAGRGPGGEWMVLEPDGAVVARVTLPGELVLLDIAGNRIAGVSRDGLGVERVEVYALGR